MVEQHCTNMNGHYDNVTDKHCVSMAQQHCASIYISCKQRNKCTQKCVFNVLGLRRVPSHRVLCIYPVLDVTGSWCVRFAIPGSSPSWRCHTSISWFLENKKRRLHLGVVDRWVIARIHEIHLPGTSDNFLKIYAGAAIS